MLSRRINLMSKKNKITQALEGHDRVRLPRMYDNFELLPELDLLGGDLYGELLSIASGTKKKCEYLNSYRIDFEQIKKEAEEKKLDGVLEYLESISGLIALCEECEN